MLTHTQFVQGVLHNNYSMYMSGSPDVHPQPLGPWASGVHIRQTTHAHDITIKCIRTYKSSDILTKNSLAVKKCEANQKQQ